MQMKKKKKKLNIIIMGTLEIKKVGNFNNHQKTIEIMSQQ